MILLKKAARSMWDNKKAYIACILLIMIGVLMSVVMGIVSDVFGTARDRYYKEYRLANIFAKVRGMPSSALSDLERLEGIDEAAGRYVYDARVLIPDNDKIITLRITSVDRSLFGELGQKDESAGDEGRQNENDAGGSSAGAASGPINGIVVTGSDFGGSTDIMVGSAFMNAHNLKSGDSIRVIIERKEYDLTICAAADSPEYVYPIKDATEILPDSEAFGYAYMPQDGLWALVNQNGMYNDVCMMLADGSTYESVKSQLEDLLKNYGLLAMYQRKDHPSVAMVDMEIDTISSMSTAMPMVFMLMAIVVLYLMLKRLIEQERVQIGVLKAFGYGNSTIIMHYTMYGAVTGAIGGVLGCIFGVAASGPYITMFKEFFNLPTENAGAPVQLLIRGITIAVAAGSLGGIFGARRAMLLNPADSMRPEAPKTVKSDPLKKLPLLRLLLSSGGNMAVRSLMRNKMRSAVIVIGMVFSFGILCFMGSYNVMIDFMMINQFSKVQRYDAKLIFETPQEYDAASDAAYRIDGVTQAESIIEIPVEFKNRNLKAGANLTGLKEGSALYSLYDNNRDCVLQPPSDGILINDVLAERLKAKKGDVIYMSSSLLDDDIKVTVTDVTEQNLGMGAYMEIDAMTELFHLNKTASSVIVKTDSMSDLKELMDDAKNLAAIEDKATTLKNYTDLLAPYGALIYVMWVMSVVVAFAIIYNTSTISLSERKREYATLRVMGMQVGEVGAIMAFEYWVLCFIGILLGIPFNLFLKEALASVFASESFTFPKFTPMSAYLQAMAGCVVAVFLANRSVVKQIRKFDMVEVLKERE